MDRKGTICKNGTKVEESDDNHELKENEEQTSVEVKRWDSLSLDFISEGLGGGQ